MCEALRACYVMLTPNTAITPHEQSESYITEQSDDDDRRNAVNLRCDPHEA